MDTMDYVIRWTLMISFLGLNLDAISVNPEDLLGVALDIMGQDPEASSCLSHATSCALRMQFETTTNTEEECRAQMTLFQCLLHGLHLSDQCQANENVNMLVGITRAYRMLVMHDCAARHPCSSQWMSECATESDTLNEITDATNVQYAAPICSAITQSTACIAEATPSCLSPWLPDEAAIDVEDDLLLVCSVENGDDPNDAEDGEGTGGGTDEDADDGTDVTEGTVDATTDEGVAGGTDEDEDTGDETDESVDSDNDEDTVVDSDNDEDTVDETDEVIDGDTNADEEDTDDSEETEEAVTDQSTNVDTNSEDTIEDTGDADSVEDTDANTDDEDTDSEGTTDEGPVISEDGVEDSVEDPEDLPASRTDTIHLDDPQSFIDTAMNILLIDEVAGTCLSHALVCGLARSGVEPLNSPEERCSADMELFQCLLHGLQLSTECLQNENVVMLSETAKIYRMYAMYDCARTLTCSEDSMQQCASEAATLAELQHINPNNVVYSAELCSALNQSMNCISEEPSSCLSSWLPNTATDDVTADINVACYGADPNENLGSGQEEEPPEEPLSRDGSSASSVQYNNYLKVSMLLFAIIYLCL